MTQKFWNNWKKRAGETKTIKFISLDNPNFRGNMLDVNFHKFENFEFTPDMVTIKFFDTISHSHKKITLLRTDIETVKF